MFRTALVLLALVFQITAAAALSTTFETDFFRLSLDEKGHVTSLFDKVNGVDYLAGGSAAPLLAIRLAGVPEAPGNMSREGDRLLLHYPGQEVDVWIQVGQNSDYLTFEVMEVTPGKPVDLVIWGPFATSIRQTIGECVGVVRNSEYAIGIQALNVKTLGGYPDEENDIEPAFSIFDSNNLTDVEADWKSMKSYRGQTAKAVENGSLLQAYTRQRDAERIISNWGHTAYVAPAFYDGGVIGSKIALFGCPAGKALDLIGRIEQAEGLPHPMIDGEWAKTARSATSSYLIISFGEADLDRALELTKKAGLNYLYHGHPFKSWGHFDLIETMFPDNWTSMKRCVDRAAAEGIRLGVHTLTNFINTNDPYVTPVPDKRLAKVGTSFLTSPVDARASDIPIESPLFFNQMENNTLSAAVIGDEIVRYRRVSSEAPWRLLGCIRGAFGTVAGAHQAGAAIGKLMDHSYKVFLSDAGLSEEIAGTLARLFNETGLRQISFDGLEGVWSTGMGQYARSLFTLNWYNRLDAGLKGAVINDASNPSHFNWHINTRYNWGEPWYAGFRESQTYYRLMNQDFYRRNLLPAMLGWFSMNASTSIEDAEWLLARAAGFDAGFAFNLNLEDVVKNAQSEAIFEAIRIWEGARMAGAFTEEQKLRMQDVSTEYRLEANGNDTWRLYPCKVERYVHAAKIRQPGEPVHSVFEFDNPYSEQPMEVIIKLVPGENQEGAIAESITLEVNNFHSLEIPVKLEQHQVIKLDRTGKLQLCDRNWKPVRTIEIETGIPVLGSGKNRITADALFGTGNSSALHIEMKTMGPAEILRVPEK
jgi:hypothetical protein